MFKRWRTRVAVAVAAAGLGALVSAPAQATPNWSDGPRLVTIEPDTIPANTPTWLTAWWRTGVAVCDFELTASGRGIGVRYPSNTRPFSSFYRYDSLGPMQADYTAVQVLAEPGRRVLHLHLSYVRTYGVYRPGLPCVGWREWREVAVPLDAQ